MAQQPNMPSGFTPDISTGQTDIQNILLLNILNKTTKNEEFGRLIKLESSYLTRSLTLLKNNPVVRLRFGGYNLDAANALAKELKARTDAREIDMILEKPVREGVSTKYTGAKNDPISNAIVNPTVSYTKLFFNKDNAGGIPASNAARGWESTVTD